jgi:outer membrane protein OmpA-like peptidoglycan-associated protein
MIKITAVLGFALVSLAAADAATPARVDADVARATMALPPLPPPVVDTALRNAAPAPEAWPASVNLSFTVLFAPGSAELRPEGRIILDKAAASLAERPDLAIELRGYAPAINDDQSQARRLSLARILGVRAYLIADGVAKLRLSVHPLGDRTSASLPPDRVDLVSAER